MGLPEDSEDRAKSIRRPSRKKTPPIRIWPATKDHPLKLLDVGGFCYLSDLTDREESFAIQKSLFLGFPQVLSGGKQAHYEAIGWCVSRKAVIINRDTFSAGGKVAVEMIDSRTYTGLPAVLGKAILALGRKCEVSLADLSEVAGVRFRTADDLLMWFEAKLMNEINIDNIVAAVVAGADTPNSPRTAKRLVVSTLLNSVNPHQFV